MKGRKELRKARMLAGVNQEEICQAIEMKQSNYSSFETGAKQLTKTPMEDVIMPASKIVLPKLARKISQLEERLKELKTAYNQFKKIVE